MGVVVTAGQDGTVSYANASFRRLAEAEDRPVLGRTFFDAFPLLSNEHVRAVVTSALQKGCVAAIEIPVTASSSDAGADPRLLLLSISSIDGPPASGSEPRDGALLMQLQEATTDSAFQLRETEVAKKHGERRNDQRVALDGELLEVNQRLVVAALREQDLKERAEEANKAKSAFLATMSHELRTPLNAIIGYASLLNDEVWGPLQAEQHAHLERLKTSARHLLTLINDVLTLARIDADKEIVYTDNVDSASLLDELLALTMPLAVAKQLKYSILPGEPFSIRTDRGKLLQILVNLVSNAIKFTNEGEITIGASVKDGEAEFCVQDTGIGISPMHLAHVFDMFWQVDQDLTRRVGGTGLGLNVSRRLARLLGGHLVAQSVPNEGSIFTVYLPMEPGGG